MKVFLGGTCNESIWRDILIDILKDYKEIDLFNPVVPDWTPECQKREIYERKISQVVVYTITPEMTGFYSIAEVVDDSNKKPESTILCILNDWEFNEGQRRSINAVGDMVKRNGSTVVNSLKELADELIKRYESYNLQLKLEDGEFDSLEEEVESSDYQSMLERKIGSNLAMFDSRVFNIPREEVTNNLIWRQQDAVRNSIQSVGQAYFSHKELDKKSQNDIQEMLFQEHGVNWNDYPIHLKQGSCCIKVTTEDSESNIVRSNWVIDEEIPIFTKNRDYIDKLLVAEEI